jgi:hypothetical protein
MAYGCFVDIIQQDGTHIRMYYPMSKWREVLWIGTNEQMAEKFNEGKRKAAK